MIVELLEGSGVGHHCSYQPVFELFPHLDAQAHQQL